MFKDTEFRDEKTFIKGKQVKDTWKFISDGTWFEKGAECKLESDCAWTGGLFRGKRVNDVDETIQENDGELCHWCEFTIYDENGELIQEPYYGWDGPDCMTFI